jgi:hypothetical protein
MADKYAPLFQEGNRPARMAPLQQWPLETALELVLLTSLIYYAFLKGTWIAWEGIHASSKN